LIIFGVVPEAIRAWKPDSAPHMITMLTNGHTAPETTGPPPERNGVVGGMTSFGCATNIPTASTTITPIFIYELR
jgi:hypothetical protein